MSQNELSQKVISRLGKLRYNKLDSLKEFESKQQETDGISKDYLRGALEEFFREIVKIASLSGLSFRGDWKKFNETRQFVNSIKWTNDVESQFIQSFYNLLSEKIHLRQKLDISTASQICWYIFDLVSEKIETPEPIKSDPRKTTAADYYSIARNFLQGVRRKRYKGYAFDVDFNKDLMEMTRKMISKRDMPLLFDLLNEETVSPNLRNRVANLLIAPCMNNDEALRAKTVEQMNEFYWNNRSTAPLMVTRGVALALANRTNNADCILDYIQWIQAENLVDENLEVTDNYYGDVDSAIEYYLERLNKPAIHSTGCVWEIFYIGRRARAKDRKTLGVLERRNKITEHPKIKQLLTEAISLLK